MKTTRIGLLILSVLLCIALGVAFTACDRDEVTATITAPNQITIESSASITGVAYNAITTNVYGVDINLCNSEGVPAGATIILKED